MVPVILIILRVLLLLFSGAAVGATVAMQSPGLRASVGGSSLGLNLLLYGGVAAAIVAVVLHLPKEGDLKAKVVAGLRYALAPVKFVISCVKEALA